MPNSSRPPLGPPAQRRDALSALEAAAPSAGSRARELTTYGELEPDIFASHRLTILQLGDSHTAADFFTGRVRERLQQAFGTGGDAYIVPGKPHLGVRSALFDSDATDGWTYEALQKSDDPSPLLSLRLQRDRASRRRRARACARAAAAPMTSVEVAFLKEPGGGQAPKC